MRMLVVVAVMVVALVGCTRDPDAAARDRAHDSAMEIAESLELPPSYEIAEIEANRAQTPKENRGGGQGGQFLVMFESTNHRDTSEVLVGLDRWFTGQGMVRADYRATGSNQCSQDRVRMGWADAEKVVVMYYGPDRPNYLIVPYGLLGVSAQGTPAVETGVPLPDCTAA